METTRPIGRPVKYPADKFKTVIIHAPLEWVALQKELKISWIHLAEAGLLHIQEKINKKILEKTTTSSEETRNLL